MNLLLSLTSVGESSTVSHPSTCKDAADMGPGKEKADRSVKVQNQRKPYMERTQGIGAGKRERMQGIKEGGKVEKDENDNGVGDQEETEKERIHDWKEGGEGTPCGKERRWKTIHENEETEKEVSKEKGGEKKTSKEKDGEEDSINDTMRALEVYGAPGEIDTQEGSLSEVQEEASSSETVNGGIENGQRRGRGKTIYTLEEVSYHCDPSSCWIVLWDHVYDVTSFIKEHPGGEDIIYEHAGRDATFTFSDVGHSNDALLMIMPYEIGVLVEHEKIFKRQKTMSLSY